MSNPVDKVIEFVNNKKFNNRLENFDLAKLSLLQDYILSNGLYIEIDNVVLKYDKYVVTSLNNQRFGITDLYNSLKDFEENMNLKEKSNKKYYNAKFTNMAVQVTADFNIR